MDVAAFDLGNSFVRKLIICGRDRCERVVALLYMLHFGLEQPSDYVALHESVAGEVHRLELKRVRSP